MSYGFSSSSGGKKRRRKPKPKPPSTVTSIAPYAGKTTGAKGGASTVTSLAPPKSKPSKKTSVFDATTGYFKTEYEPQYGRSYTEKAEAKRERAKAYERSTTQKILERNVKRDEAGEPVTRETQQPISKEAETQAEHAVRRARERFRSRLNEARRPAEAERAQDRLRRDARRIEGKYFEEVEAPVIPKDRQEAVSERLERVDERAKRLREGDLRYEDLRPSERRRTRSYLQAREEQRAAREDARTTSIGEAVAEAIGTAGEATGGALRKAQEVLTPATDPELGEPARPMERVRNYLRAINRTGPAESKTMGFNLDEGAGTLSEALQVDPETGLLKAVDYLSRPKQAVLAGVGKGLAAAGAGTPAEQRAFKRKAGPLAALGESPESRRVTTGGEIAKAIGLPEWTGLGFEIAGDPLMYVGAGALTPARGALVRGARFEAALAKRAPEELADDTLVRLRDDAMRHGRTQEWADALAERAKARGVGPFSKRSAEPVVKEFDQYYEGSLRSALDQAATYDIGRATHKGVAEAKRISQSMALRAGAMRSVEPGLRVSLGNPLRPLDRPWVTARIPVRGPLADVKFIPSRQGLQSWNEFSRYTSRNRALREAHRQSRAMQVAFDRRGQQVLREVFKPITHTERGVVPRMDELLDRTEESRQRIGLWAAIRSDKQSPEIADEVMSKYGRGLTEQEKEVVNRLDTFAEAFADDGKTLGYLKTTVPNYTPRHWVDQADTYKAYADPADPLLTAPTRGSAVGSKPSFAHHREAESPMELWDKNLQAQALRDLAGYPEAEALKVAEEAWEISPPRVLMNSLLRHLQLGGRVQLEELPSELQRLVRVEVRQGGDSKLLDPDLHDGWVRLSPQSESMDVAGMRAIEGRPGEQPFLHDPFAGLTADEAVEARRYSIIRSIDELNSARAERIVEDEYSAAMDDMADRLRAQLDEGPSAREGRPRGLDAMDRRVAELEEMKRIAEDRLRDAHDAGDLQRIQNLEDGIGRVDDELETLRRERAAIEDAQPGSPMGQAQSIVENEESILALQAQKRQLESRLQGGIADDATGEAVVAEYEDVSNQLDQLYGERDGLLSSARPGEPGIPPQVPVGGELRDPLDYLGRMKDRRVKGTTPILDVGSTMFWRSRSDAVKSAQFARYQAIDEAVGVPANDWKKVGLRRGEDEYTYYDAQGRMWRDPTMKAGDNGIEAAVEAALKGRGAGHRLWPADAIEDAKLESMRLGEGTYKEIFESGVENHFNRFMATMRYGVTVPFPAYHIRNMVSDALKSVQAGGTGMLFHPFMSMKLWSTALLRDKAGYLGAKFGGDGRLRLPGSDIKMDPQDFLLMSDLFGIRSGLHLSEYMRIVRQGKMSGLRPHERAARLAMIGPSGVIGKRMLEMGARREDIFRFQTFAQRLRTNGGDAADAAWYTIKHHFDYDDLQHFEKKWFRSLFFFYTWYRKNIPLQFAEIISRPGFFSGLGSTYHALKRGETPVNQDWSRVVPWAPDMSGPVPARLDATLPSYMRNPLSAVAVKWNDHAAQFAFGAPWADMNLVGNLNPLNDRKTFQQGVRQALIMANPILSLIAGPLGLQKDILTGRDLNNYEPVPGWVGDFAEWLNMDVRRDKYGQPYLPYELTATLRNIPIFGRAAGYGLPGGSTSARDTGWLGSSRAIPSLLGVTSRVSVPPERLEQAWGAMWAAKKAELTEASFATPSDFTNATKVELSKDRTKEVLQWAVDHEIPFEWLQANAPGLTGVYIPEDEREKAPAEGFDDAAFGGDTTEGKGFGADFGGTEFGEKKEPKAPEEYRPGKRFERQMMRYYNRRLAEKRRSGRETVLEPVDKIPEPYQGKAAKAKTTSFGGGGRFARPDNATVLAHYGAASSKAAAEDQATKGRRGARIIKKLAAGLPDPKRGRSLAAAAVRASRKTGVPASLLMGVSGQESNYGTNEGPSTAGARGPMQFIPDTRDAFIEQYGVDAWGSDEEAMLAAAIHLKNTGDPDKLEDVGAALQGYSGGYSADAYDNPIIERARNFKKLDKLAGSKLKVPNLLATAELYYDPVPGLMSPSNDHDDHVHFASEDPLDTLRAAKIADKMGLTVAENVAFGGVAPVHVSGSYHYQEQKVPGHQRLKRKAGATGDVVGRGIDVTGPADRMAAYATRLKGLSGGTAGDTGGVTYGGAPAGAEYGLSEAGAGEPSVGLAPGTFLQGVSPLVGPTAERPVEPGTPAPAQTTERFGPLPGSDLVAATRERLGADYGLGPAFGPGAPATAGGPPPQGVPEEAAAAPAEGRGPRWALRRAS